MDGWRRTEGHSIYRASIASCGKKINNEERKIKLMKTINAGNVLVYGSSLQLAAVLLLNGKDL